MQPGAGFVLDGSDLARLSNNERQRAVAWVGPVGQALDHAAVEVFDVASRSGRYAAVYATDDEVVLLELDRVGYVHVSMIRACPSTSVRRVAMTNERWYVASDAEVYVLAQRTGAFELLAVDAVDLAASTTELCALDSRGATWFDANGQVITRRWLSSPTAVAFDPLARGWLIAADGDILQLAAPTAEPVVLARGVGLAQRIRRDVDALYAVVDGELLEVEGVRNGPTRETPRAIASYARGWSQFDAHYELYVDEGSGPCPFYRSVPCACRVRRIEIVEAWAERRSYDGGHDHFERQRCPRCGETWIYQPAG